MTPARAGQAAPGFDWTAFLAAADLGAAKPADRAAEHRLPEDRRDLRHTPLETLKAWQAFNVTDSAAPYLSRPLRRRPLRLPQQGAVRPAGAAAALEAGGRLRRRRTSARRSGGSMWPATSRPSQGQDGRPGGDLHTALDARIEKLAWMSPATKAKALEKLSKFTVKIGYPANGATIRASSVSADDLYGNIERGALRVGRAFSPDPARSVRAVMAVSLSMRRMGRRRPRAIRPQCRSRPAGRAAS